MADKNYVDYKVTSWKRAKFKDDADMQAVKDMVESGDFDMIFDDELGFEEVDDVEMTDDEDMTVEENGGYATIEVYENEKEIYINGK